MNKSNIVRFNKIADYAALNNFLIEESGEGFSFLKLSDNNRFKSFNFSSKTEIKDRELIYAENTIDSLKPKEKLIGKTLEEKIAKDKEQTASMKTAILFYGATLQGYKETIGDSYDGLAKEHLKRLQKEFAERMIPKMDSKAANESEGVQS